jgi:fused signal recognition particle receptor
VVDKHQVPRARTLLILDATTGQNGLQQAKSFLDVSGVDGVIITKLDGTARGGIVFSIVKELEVPVLFVGTGEKLDDISEFDPEAFVEALFAPMRR